MAWNPTNGFHIAARVRRSTTSLFAKEIKNVSLDRPKILRMKLDRDMWAFAPNVFVDDMSLLLGGRLSIDTDRVIFIQAQEKDVFPKSWYSSALYETKTELTLPDLVRRETIIGHGEPAQHFSRSGLNYKDDLGQHIVGQMSDIKYLDVTWSLPKDNWTKAQSYRFAEVLQEAISIVAGESLVLRHHKLRRGKRIYTEVRAGNSPTKLGIIFRPFDYDILDKNVIVQITNFLAQSTNEADICLRTFHQLADAARQQTWQARELLLSTLLEAALRSLYNKPFAPEKSKRTDTFSLETSLKQFREEYWSDDVEIGRQWKKATSKVIETQRRLRDRNAHPDWLTNQGGAYSPTEMENTMNDMIFLSRFYGYMILALVGFRNLKPRFPAPFARWHPLITIGQVPPDEVTET